jgi:malonyl-CoA O-methyltransferase
LEQLTKHQPNILAAPMSTERPPTIDPVAAARWAQRVSGQSPWLHEEVARRMEDRVHWEPARGGLEAHGLLTKRYPKSECFVLENRMNSAQAAHKSIAPPWWSPARWTGPKVTLGAPPNPVHMLWANMALHMAADPQALIQRWNRLIATDGFLMFSCLGPDTLRELRQLYARQGWGAPSHEFTDMHDWGDMLVRAGFAEPVMDMERITLSYSSPQSLLQELRTLGRNLHVGRAAGLKGRTWLTQLQVAMSDQLQSPTAVGGEAGRLTVTFEIIYGHAFKPQPRLTVLPETTVSLDEMRNSLRNIKKNSAEF